MKGRADLLQRVLGDVRFVADVKLPRMLHAKIVRSPYAHAKIDAIDFSAALATPGVVAVLAGRDLPERFGILPWTRDETALAIEVARFVGDGVAAVAATSERAATDAARRVAVTWQELPAAVDIDSAIAHPEIALGAKKDNVSKHVKLEFGDVDAALKDAIVVENDYAFQGTAHAPIEPHATIANVDGDGRLTVWSTTQVTHYLHRELAHVLGMNPAHVHVIQPPIGGAFGGKSEPFGHEIVAAKLALLTRRPIKIVLTREEEFYVHRGRHPMRMRMRVGARADGKLAGIDVRTDIDGGAYSSFGLVTTYYSGQLVAMPTAPETYRFESTRYFTNKPPCGPKRGHGSVQPRFALEVALDELAEKLSIDPIELRRRNAVKPESTTLNGMRITSCGYLECLEAVERASGWKERRGKLGYGRGLGVASSAYISGTNYPIYPNEMPQSAVQLKVDRSGLVTVFSGASEIGQGSDTVLRTIVASELGIPLDLVRVVSGDTDLCPVDLGAYSSRGTFMNGNAALMAARQIKEKLVAVDDGTAQPFDELVRRAEARFGTLGAVGWYKSPPNFGGSYRGGTIGASPAYSFTAHVAEVDVDVETGVVRVVKVWCAHDCGHAICRTNVVGQIEGSVYMGVAEALLEEHAIGPQGLHRGPDLLSYRIPTSLDSPEQEALIVESQDPEGPLGAKEAGEGPLHSSIPAVANAVYDAIGVRVRTLPITPERVLRALRERAS